MRPAESLDALARDPLDRYFFGSSWLVFFASHGRCSGTIVWGEPGGEAVEQWEAFARLRLSARFERHEVLFDVRRIDQIGASAFCAFGRYASANAELIDRHVSRLALAHGDGLAGATAAGFLVVRPLSIAARAFDDVDAALRWLGHQDDAPLLTELHRVIDASIARAPVLRDLEIFLERYPSATPEHAARALGLSIRSLQRRLSEQGTTFRRMLDATRVRLAQALLTHSDASITAIALEVGLTSPQHLSTLFRKSGHGTPRAWRGSNRPPAR